MQWFSRTSIRYKILIIPACACLSFIAYLAYNYIANADTSVRLTKLRDVYFPVLETANTNIVRLDRIDELMTQAISTGESDPLDAVKELHEAMKIDFARQEKLLPDAKASIDKIETLADDYLKTSLKIAEVMLSGTGLDRIQRSIADKAKLQKQLKDQLQQFRKISYEDFTGTVTAADQSLHRVLSVGLAVGGATILLVIAVSLPVSGSIMNALRKITDSLQEIAEGDGDLTRRIHVGAQDELGKLAADFNRFVDKLQKAIGEVVHVVGPLHDVSHALEDVMKQTTGLSSKQSRDSERTLDAIAVMSAKVSDVATHAVSAAKLASSADDDAKQGRVVVSSMVRSIDEVASEVERAAGVIRQLESDVGNVSKILDVIKAVAEQTNLLALNAAIEAARAGEQGRGFAVVADEVRTLASRTQQSTAEIRQVIEKLQSAAHSAVDVMQSSQQRASSGVSQANAAGSSLQSITERIESISGMNREIAAATTDQQKNADAIQSSVQNLRDTATDSAGSVARVAEFSGSLARLAAKLSDVAGQFRI
jgi:methyl-accepting chemotaxis protein